MEIHEVRVKLYVPDFDRRRAFYLQTLGLRIRNEWGQPADRRGVMFVIGAVILELLEDLSATNQKYGADLSLEVPDVWSLWRDTRDRAEVHFELRDNTWGDTSFCIMDPGGFRITFFSVRNSKES